MKETSNRYVKAFCNPGALWALLWVAFQLWMVIHGSYSAMVTRAIHTCFGMGMVFLTYPMLKKNRVGKGQTYFPKWYEYIPFVITVASGIYILLNADRYSTRMAYVDPLTMMDYAVAIALLVLLVECSRRAVNLALTIIVLAFIAYGFYGQYLPGLLTHGVIAFPRFIEAQIYSTSGVFGAPVSVACGTVFYFLLFGAFLTATPAGQLFVNISSLLTRRANGGAGKATVVASALFGMISGSAPGNVASIGTIMYEPMKRQGFDNRFTGSILAIGGTAGQLIPPVMGAAAFIMVDMAGIPYSKIMLAAILPSFVFMAALYILIDLYARKNHLSKPEIDPAACRREIAKHLHLLLSVVVLVWLIMKGQTMMYACSAATLALIALCMLRRDTRLTLFSLLQTLVSTGRQAVIVTMPCAVAGIIVGQITVTGLGVRFSSMINALASNSLLPALLATMLMALILGMGVPTAAAYILSATLLCPSLIKLGAPVIAAHFFVFYFANLSMITPPVALSSFTAAGIVGDNMWKLGLSAFRYSFIIFLIPFTFVYNPALLGVGAPLEILQVTVTCLLGAYGLSTAMIGYGVGPLKWYARIVAVAASICLVIPGNMTDLVGLLVLGALLGAQVLQRSRRAKTNLQEGAEL
jgi:TRAP transporter 4TM/12TM fusion protein